MIDRFGRPLTSLRISVTDECNLNCFYCHREGCPASQLLMSPQEIGQIAELAAKLGMKRIKLTGGEPLMRKDIVEIVAEIAKAPVEEISLTTNGTLLSQYAKELARAGLKRVNISLDTLKPEKFLRITGSDMLEEVLRGVESAVNAGLNPVKLNMVVLSGINDDEIEDMISFASKHGAILQLIELLLPEGDKGLSCYYRDLAEIERNIQSRAIAFENRKLMHARKKYILPEGAVEIVRPMHNTEFCMHCTRLRVTADGRLKPCLMRNDNLVDLLPHIRASDTLAAQKDFLNAISKREPFFKGERKPRA